MGTLRDLLRPVSAGHPRRYHRALRQVRAKGAGSSKPHTRLYGKEFNQAQVREKVGAALLKALTVISAGRARAAIAIPDMQRYRSLLAPVMPALRQLQVTILWVQDNGKVIVDGPAI